MEERPRNIEKVQKELEHCESRLKELQGKEKSEHFGEQLGQIEGELKTCKLELDKLEGRSGDEWVDAEYKVTKKLEDVRRSLELTSDKMIRFIG